MTLFDNLPPAVAASPTSVAAAESLAGSADALRARVLRHIREMGGATCDEVEKVLDMRHQTASARIWELRKAGFIHDGGRTRKTRSGRSAVVWEIRP
jgi:predicted transcriptional regulator